jgi:hypothetical protein
MPQITFKETVTKTIDIPLDTLISIVDRLTVKEKTQLMAHLKAKVNPVKIFQKDRIGKIIQEFRATDLYEDDFLNDLKDGLKKSSHYRSQHANRP